MIVRAGLSPDVWRGHPARGHSDGWCGHPACVFRSRENPVFRSSENPFSHALGRRIEHVNDVLGLTTDYYFDGANELAEYRGSGDGDRMRYTVHGVAYIDEHLMMMVDVAGTSNDRPYYYVQDRLYNVWAMIDRAGAIVERYAYDAYGLPLIRESAGRGDMNNDTLIDADADTDKTRFFDARDGVIWDPRADMDDDGDVDDDDVLLWSDADNVWPESEPTVAQAFSDVGNPFMFQGVSHFALDTADDAETATLPLNHHRARFADPVTGRWGTRDPLTYADGLNPYEYARANPVRLNDPLGLCSPCERCGRQIDTRLCEKCPCGPNVWNDIDWTNDCHIKCYTSVSERWHDFRYQGGHFPEDCLHRCLDYCNRQPAPEYWHAEDFWRLDAFCGDGGIGSWRKPPPGPPPPGYWECMGDCLGGPIFELLHRQGIKQLTLRHTTVGKKIVSWVGKKITKRFAMWVIPGGGIIGFGYDFYLCDRECR